jgi:hypothetical protein
MEIHDEGSRDKSERAYAVWSTEAGCDMEKTASICGIPLRSLYHYKSRDNWENRFDLEKLGDTDDAVVLAAQIIRGGMPRVAEKMLYLCVGEKPVLNADGQVTYHPETGKPLMMPAAEDKDAITAARWLMQYGLASAADILRGDDKPLPGVSLPKGYEPGSTKELTPGQQARDILNANYSLHNSRSGKRRGR